MIESEMEKPVYIPRQWARPRPSARHADALPTATRRSGAWGKRLALVIAVGLVIAALWGVSSAARGTLGDNALAAWQAEGESCHVISAAEATALVAVAVATPSATATPTIAPSPTPLSLTDLLDQAWKDDNWPQVISIVEGMVAGAPGDANLKEKLFAAHFNYGVHLVRAEKLAEAVAEFDKALAINPGDSRAVGERKFANLYLQGTTALSAGDFATAIEPLRTIVNGNPDYRSAKARLYNAYVGYADSLEKSGKNADAYLTYQKASKVDGQGAEALAGLARLKDVVPAPTPTPTPTPKPAPAASAAGKKIEVNIAKQQVTVWDNNKVLWVFKASTGKSPYLTRKGDFTILSKMPNAYSSAMQWGMPSWMGIYYAGKWENGFHAMARVGKNQTKLSESVLGKPATHGCIMLSDKDAKTLYDWAVIGTAVWIH